MNDGERMLVDDLPQVPSVGTDAPGKGDAPPMQHAKGDEDDVVISDIDELC